MNPSYHHFLKKKIIYWFSKSSSNYTEYVGVLLLRLGCLQSMPLQNKEPEQQKVSIQADEFL